MSRTNEEVRNEILKRVKELDQKSVTRKKIIYSCIPAAACLAIILTVVLYNSSAQNNIVALPPQSTTSSKSNNSSSTVPNSTTENYTTQQQSTQPTKETNKVSVHLFPASKQNPNVDYFTEDECPHIDVVLNGKIIYRQLPLEEYPEYGLNKRLTKSDFGAFIGTVVETAENDPSVKVGAQEPTLKGSSVYYYAPSNKSALIVQKGEYCSIFVFDQFDDDKSPGFKEIYSLYGTYSADDIAYLSYTVQGMEGTQYCEIEKGNVTNRNKINTFYKITTALVPFEIKDPIAVTPDWLIEAHAEYNAHPEDYKREDINVNIHFKNGMIFKYFDYLPYLSTGYVEGMELLTPEQNTELRAAITAD